MPAIRNSNVSELTPECSSAWGSVNSNWGKQAGEHSICEPEPWMAFQTNRATEIEIYFVLIRRLFDKRSNYTELESSSPFHLCRFHQPGFPFRDSIFSPMKRPVNRVRFHFDRWTTRTESSQTFEFLKIVVPRPSRAPR